tara:strand:+ start:862 stop:1644 length:783 start_codon:yes stop_codon:yes gene_type:complete
MESTKLNEAITQYYKLKEEYEDKINQNKLKIINNPILTLNEKEKKFKQIKKYCINCKSEGGTIFSNKDGILKAKCGNLSKPCGLNIEIKKGKYVLSDDLVNNLQKKINNIKIEIIKIKLDFLFNYISESEALAQFNTLKEELSKQNNLYQKAEIFNINITDNPQTKSLLDAANHDLFVEVQKIKDFCKVYKISKNKLLLNNVAENYISSVLPLTKTISDLKYLYKTVDNIENISYLIEKKFTLASLEFPLEHGKILDNKK